MANENRLHGGDQELLASLLDNYGFAVVLRAVAQYARDCLGEEYSPGLATPSWNQLHVVHCEFYRSIVDPLQRSIDVRDAGWKARSVMERSDP